MEIEEILRQKRLEYISVDTTEAVKLEYLIGDNFNSEGIKIYGHYSDETQVEEDLRLVSFSGFDSSQAAEKNTITVLFNEKETTFDVKIHESKIEKIQIIQKPIKQFFRVGESNDTTGIIVKATYTNGNETPLAEDEYILEGFDSSKAGMCLVNVILKEDTKIYDTYTVVFQDYDITGITINKQPNKLIYMVGEELDLTGLEVYATPENGLPPFLLPQYNYSPASIKDITATGKQTITINVNEVKASFDIEIVDAYVKGFVIKDRDGNGKPKEGIIEDSKRIYCAGDTFKLEHFAFYELYSNDAIGQVITSDNGKMEKLSFVFDGEEHGYEDECQFGDEPGVYTIPIRYEFEDITTKENTSSTIEIKVCVTDSEIARIEADWSSERASGYPKWITPDNSNSEYGKWTVNAILKTGKDIDITNMCSFEYTETDSNNRSVDGEGKVEVTVKYHDIRTKKDFITTGKVEVRERILQKVEIVTLPKTVYVVGEDVDLDDLEVKGTYSDGEEISIYYSPQNVSVKPKTISQDSSQIVVSYQDGVTCTIPITKIPNDVSGIIVDPSRKYPSGNFYFREGKKYEWDSIDDYFSVDIIRVNCKRENIGDNDKQYLNYTIKNGSIIIVYNPSKEKTYSTIYNNTNIRILPALPTSVEIVLSENDLYNGLEDIIDSNDTKLKVKYANLNEKEITKRKDGIFIDDEVGTYELKKTNDRIDVKFTPEKYAVDEDKSFVKNFENVLSKNKIYVKEVNGSDNVFYFKQENGGYDFAQKFNVYMEFNNGHRKKIESNGSLTFTPLLTSYDYKEDCITDKLLVTYADTEDSNCYYYTYDKFKYYPPMPIHNDIFLKTDEPDEKDGSSPERAITIDSLDEIIGYLGWKITYKDGSELTKGAENVNNDKRLKPEFTIDENNTILLKGNCWQPEFSEKIEDKGDYIYKITVKDETLYFKLNNNQPEVSEGDGGGATQ